MSSEVNMDADETGVLADGGLGGQFHLTDPPCSDMIIEMDNLRDLLGQRIADCKTRLKSAQDRVAEIEAELVDYQNALAREIERHPSEGELNKTVALLKFVKENQSHGVTHWEMREHLRSLGVTVSKNFTYNFVDRFKNKKVVEREGRIYRLE